MRFSGSSRSCFAFMAAAMLFSVSAAPVKTAVFTGVGPRGRGLVSWLQLVESSPELDLVLVDAKMIREQLNTIYVKYALLTAKRMIEEGDSISDIPEFESLSLRKEEE